MTDGPGGELDEEAWAASAGRVGAAPAPNWAQAPPGDAAPPPAPPPPTTPSPAAAPRPSGQPPTHPLHTAAEHPADPYSAPAFSDSGSSGRGRTRSPYARRAPYGGTIRSTSRRAPKAWWGRGPGPVFITVSAVLSVCSFGLLTFVFFLVSAVRAGQARQMARAEGQPLSPAVRGWRIATLVFGVATLVAYGALIAIGATTSSSGSSGQSTSATLPSRTADLGQPLDFDQGYDKPVPATVVVTTATEQAGGVEEVGFTVCARAKTLDPLFVAESLDVQTDTGGQDVSSSTAAPLPEVFYSDLAPHTCASGASRYLLPQGAHAALVTDNDSNPAVSWRLPLPATSGA